MQCISVSLLIVVHHQISSGWTNCKAKSPWPPFFFYYYYFRRLHKQVPLIQCWVDLNGDINFIGLYLEILSSTCNLSPPHFYTFRLVIVNSNRNSQNKIGRKTQLYHFITLYPAVIIIFVSALFYVFVLHLTLLRHLVWTALWWRRRWMEPNLVEEKRQTSGFSF